MSLVLLGKLLNLLRNQITPVQNLIAVWRERRDGGLLIRSRGEYLSRNCLEENVAVDHKLNKILDLESIGESLGID